MLNVTELERSLASGDVSIASTGAGGIEATDVGIHAQMSWRALTKMSLSAQRSVIVQRKVSVSGQGNVEVVFGSKKIDGRLAFRPNGRTRFAKQTRQLRSNGVRYDLVSSIAAFAAKAPDRHRAVALMDNYDASVDGTYKTSPIPGGLNIVQGLGNLIDNVTI